MCGVRGEVLWWGGWNVICIVVGRCLCGVDDVVFLCSGFFFYWFDDHRDLHRVGRRQRQMCIGDSPNGFQSCDIPRGINRP